MTGGEGTDPAADAKAAAEALANVERMLRSSPDLASPEQRAAEAAAARAALAAFDRLEKSAQAEPEKAAAFVRRQKRTWTAIRWVRWFLIGVSVASLVAAVLIFIVKAGDSGSGTARKASSNGDAKGVSALVDHYYQRVEAGDSAAAVADVCGLDQDRWRAAQTTPGSDTGLGIRAHKIGRVSKKKDGVWLVDIDLTTAGGTVTRQRYVIGFNPGAFVICNVVYDE